MEPLNPVPPSAQLNYPDHHELLIGPPENVAEEDCGYSAALVGHVKMGVFDGAAVMRTFFRPTKEELEALNEDGYIELYFIANQMPPHNLTVWKETK